jgi:plastocyanin
MSSQQITIQPNACPSPAQPAAFNPQTVTAFAGDNLTWVNNDKHDHWPAPSADNKTGWFQYQIPPDSSSRGDLALGPNSVSVTAASNATQAVLTVTGSAPQSSVTVKLTYAAPKPAPNPPSPWAAVNGKSFVVTNTGPNTVSIPLDSTAFGALVGTITMFVPYTLNYVCALHPDETGTITVNPQQ